jgi:hypothetical protein
VAAIAVAGRAHGQGDRRLTIEPYAWVPTLQGEGSADGPVDVDFEIDYPGELSAALPLALRLETPDRLVWMLDLLYARWEDDDGSAQTESELSILDASVGWPVTDGWDFATGLRAVELGLDVEVGGVSTDASEALVDPWIGGRTDLPLGDGGWAVRAWGDVGGFGIGSDFTWQAATLVGYGSESWRVELGYRALAVRIDEDDLETDLLAHGPMLGVAFRL